MSTTTQSLDEQATRLREAVEVLNSLTREEKECLLEYLECLIAADQFYGEVAGPTEISEGARP